MSKKDDSIGTPAAEHSVSADAPDCPECASVWPHLERHKRTDDDTRTCPIYAAYRACCSSECICIEGMRSKACSSKAT